MLSAHSLYNKAAFSNYYLILTSDKGFILGICIGNSTTCDVSE